LTEELACLLSRVAQTEKRVVKAFARALTTHHRAHELRCRAREAHPVAKRLRSKQEEVPKVMLPSRLDE
jgi:hypothetical protein